VNEPKRQNKPFDISKWAVWKAYQRVKANKGAAGVDDVSFAEFEQDRDKHLYRIWNRMSSGSYFPPPVKAVEIPKAGGKGVRVLGVPTISDRIAQTVARMYLEPEVEPVFHPDSYGYRPGKSALDAVGMCRQRCWKADWVIDLDIKAFFDSVPWDLILKAVEHPTPGTLGVCGVPGCFGPRVFYLSLSLFSWLRWLCVGMAAARLSRRVARVPRSAAPEGGVVPPSLRFWCLFVG
jgi:RNA-directed DNA polymerase